MRKVSILTGGWSTMDLEKAVNEFIEKHPNVIDIQYRTSAPGGLLVNHYAMIIYEDGDGK